MSEETIDIDKSRCESNIKMHQDMREANNEKLGTFLGLEETKQNELIIKFLQETMKHDKEMKSLWELMRDNFKVIKEMRGEQTERYHKFLKDYKDAGTD